jgi:hypothetical protein
MAEVKIKTLTEQEQIRIDNLLIQEKNAENSRIQDWQRTWNANIDTLSFDDIKDVKSVLVKSKLADLKHYSNEYEEIYTSTEKRLHSQIELISKAEEQRIAQEKFLAEKKEFEEKQAEAKFQERCKQITDLGFVLNETNIAYQKGLHYLNLEDIRLASDDLWLRELEDAKNIKDFSEMEVVEVSDKEVEFEDYNEADVDVKGVVKTHEFANYQEEVQHIEKVTENKVQGESVFDVEKIESQIWDNIIEEWHTDFHGMTFLEYLKEFYHAPTKKQ